MTAETKLFGLATNTKSKRLLVVATYASYAGLCFFPSAMQDGSGLARAVAPIAAGVSGMLLGTGWLVLARLLKEYGFPGDHRLFVSRDERQTGVRHRAFVRAYWILNTLICCVALYWMLAADAGLWLPDPAYRKQILFGLILLCSSLPSAVIAWTEPDEELASEDAAVLRQPPLQI